MPSSRALVACLALVAFTGHVRAQQEGCRIDADIFIAIDGSGSVEEEGWELEKNFVKNFTGVVTDAFQGSGGVRIGVMQFSGAADGSDSEVFVSLNDPAATDLSAIATIMDGKSHPDGFTPSAFALDTTRAQFTTHGRPGVTHLVVFLSDGKPCHPNSNNNCNSQGVGLAETAATALKAAGVRVLTVAFGPESADAAAVEFLLFAASEPKSVYARSSSFANLGEIIQPASQAACIQIKKLDRTCATLVGGETLLITGENLYDLTNDGSLMGCRFFIDGGAPIDTQAQPRGTEGTEMTCPTPQVDNAVIAIVEVTIDGRVYSNNQFRFQFAQSLDDCLYIESLGSACGVPTWLQPGSPLQILVKGRGLVLEDFNSDSARCRFTSRETGAVTVTQGRVLPIPSGAANGLETSMECDTPTSQTTLGPARLEVSVNGGASYTSDNKTFTFVQEDAHCIIPCEQSWALENECVVDEAAQAAQGFAVLSFTCFDNFIQAKKPQCKFSYTVSGQVPPVTDAEFVDVAGSSGSPRFRCPVPNDLVGTAKLAVRFNSTSTQPDNFVDTDLVIVPNSTLCDWTCTQVDYALLDNSDSCGLVDEGTKIRIEGSRLYTDLDCQWSWGGGRITTKSAAVNDFELECTVPRISGVTSTPLELVVLDPIGRACNAAGQAFLLEYYQSLETVDECIEVVPISFPCGVTRATLAAQAAAQAVRDPNATTAAPAASTSPQPSGTEEPELPGLIFLSFGRWTSTPSCRYIFYNKTNGSIVDEEHVVTAESLVANQNVVVDNAGAGDVAGRLSLVRQWQCPLPNTTRTGTAVVEVKVHNSKDFSSSTANFLFALTPDACPQPAILVTPPPAEESECKVLGMPCWVFWLLLVLLLLFLLAPLVYKRCKKKPEAVKTAAVATATAVEQVEEHTITDTVKEKPMPKKNYKWEVQTDHYIWSRSGGGARKLTVDYGEKAPPSAPKKIQKRTRVSSIMDDGTVVLEPYEPTLMERIFPCCRCCRKGGGEVIEVEMVGGAAAAGATPAGGAAGAKV